MEKDNKAKQKELLEALRILIATDTVEKITVVIKPKGESNSK